MAAITKSNKTNKIDIFLQNHLVYLAEILYGAILGSWLSELLNREKSYSRIRSK